MALETTSTDSPGGTQDKRAATEVPNRQDYCQMRPANAANPETKDICNLNSL